MKSIIKNTFTTIIILSIILIIYLGLASKGIVSYPSFYIKQKCEGNLFCEENMSKECLSGGLCVN